MNQKLLILILLSITLLSSTVFAADRAGAVLPETSIFQLAGTKCGIINGKAFSGNILKNGKFLTFKKKIATLRAKASNATGDTKTKLTNQIAKFKKRKKTADAVCLAYLSNTAIPGAVIATDSTSPDSFENPELESIHLVYCPAGLEEDTVWGTGIYTADSGVCTAAVHAGLISYQSGGNVIVKIKAGLENYLGTTQNGVETRPYGSWPLSFVFLDDNSGEELS